MKWVGDARLPAGPEATWYLETAFTPGAHLGTVYDDPTTPVVVEQVEAGSAVELSLDPFNAVPPVLPEFQS
jgi:hypothetical protein